MLIIESLNSFAKSHLGALLSQAKVDYLYGSCLNVSNFDQFWK